MGVQSPSTLPTLTTVYESEATVPKPVFRKGPPSERLLFAPEENRLASRFSFGHKFPVCLWIRDD